MEFLQILFLALVLNLILKKSTKIILTDNGNYESTQMYRNNKDMIDIDSLLLYYKAILFNMFSSWQWQWMILNIQYESIKNYLSKCKL
jgi:hypothetical protein